MTIKVTLTHDEPESDRVIEARVVSPIDGTLQNAVVLMPGDKHQFFLHQGANLIAEEIGEDDEG